jgi:hypothetical protein
MAKYLILSVLAWIGIFAAGLALCGLTGIAHTEYKLGTGAEAVALALGWSCYGAIPGLATGLLLHWWLHRKQPPQD